MICNQIEDNILQRDKEEAFKSNAKSNHSTDTEPEVEGDISTLNKKKTEEEEIEKKEVSGGGEEIKRKIRSKNGFDYLIHKIPTYKYENSTRKKRKNNTKMTNKDHNNKGEEEIYLMNELYTNNNRFVSYEEGFLTVAKHCLRYHNKFTREQCRQYLERSYIIDFSHDEFIPFLSHLRSREFNKYFMITQRQLKYI